MADNAASIAGSRRRAIRLDGSGPSRLPLAGGGRAHVDRALPFLILNRRRRGRQPCRAGRGDQPELRAVARCQRRRSARRRRRHRRRRARRPSAVAAGVALRPAARPFARSGTAQAGSVHGAAQRLRRRAGAGGGGAADRSARERSRSTFAPAASSRSPTPGSSPGVEALVAAPAVRVAPLARACRKPTACPARTASTRNCCTSWRSRVFDALLQAAHAFLAQISPDAPASHRALGRRSFIDAARSVDRKLLRISTSFDFLLSVSPINSEAAYEQFKADKVDEDADLPLPPADRRSRPRQARALCDRPAPRRGSGARAPVRRETARARPAADDARLPQHAAISAMSR